MVVMPFSAFDKAFIIKNTSRLINVPINYEGGFTFGGKQMHVCMYLFVHQI